MSLMDRWVDFLDDVARRTPYIYTGAQAIHPDLEWTMPAEELMGDQSMVLDRIGFTDRKIQQLKKWYENPVTIERAKSDVHDRISSKKYGSGVWDFRGSPKKNTKQDFCITSGTVAYYPGKDRNHTRITINYRTVELIFRFRADLIFLRDVILPQFELDCCPPDTITFRFVNATLHPMFYIMLLIEHPNFEKHLDDIQLAAPKLYKEIIRWTNIHIKGDYRAYATAARVQNFVKKLGSPNMDDINAYVQESLDAG